MACFEHLDKEASDKITGRLWELRSILKGQAALFQQCEGAIELDTEALSGIGQLLKEIAEELTALDDDYVEEKNP